MPLGRSRPRIGLLLILAGLAGLLVALAPGAGAATGDGGTITGTVLGPDDAPVAGVTLTATNKDGFSASATTDAQGAYSIDTPDRRAYELTLDVTTLPAGLQMAKEGDEKREISSMLAGKKTIKFKLAAGEGSGGAAASGGAGGTDWVAQVSQLVVDGFFYGLLIALGAVGLNLIFGTTGLTNFAHGELITLGAFTALTLNLWGLPVIAAVPLALLVSAILWGWGQNKILWAPLRRRKTGLIASMVVSIGLAITLRYTIALVFGESPQNFTQYTGQDGLHIGPVSITAKQMILAGLAIVALALTVAWLQNSRIGKATRAVSDNPALASATGIDVERVIAVVWTLGAGLAALAGVYLGLNQDVAWNMGQRILLVLFAAVTLGGLGTIYGAIVGAMVVGMFVQLSTLIIPTEMKTVGALFLMILILLVRPQGILGRRERVG